MAITINWVTGVITVPKADMTLITLSPYEFRELNTDDFRKTLRDLEDDPDGRPWPKTHVHETETTLSGVIYARKIRILAPYTITFEDGQYAVNLTGSNNNILDVNNKNQVSVNPSNSAGLINQDLAAQVWDAPLTDHEDDTQFGGFVQTLLTIVKFLGLK